jgi:hypothetical protein
VRCSPRSGARFGLWRIAADRQAQAGVQA